MRSRTRSDDTIDRAIEELGKAKAAEKANTLDEALTLYKRGIELLLEGAKRETKNERRELITRETEYYMRHAEELRSTIDQAGARPWLPSTVANIFGYGSRKTLLPDNGTESLSKLASNSPAASGARRAPATSRSVPVVSKSLTNGTRSTANIATRSRPPASSGANSTLRRTASAPVKAVETATPTTHQKASAEFEAIILSNMLDTSPGVAWEDIAGLERAKQILQEAVILPNLRPDLFTGLRAPPRGVLLYGPPGTGKTMLAKAVATESGFNFFNISASALTSKYVGDGEKLVRALFSVARARQPSVVFIDEVDSILSSRGANEHEASRRLKTEFMVQLEGVSTEAGERLLVMGATNLPQELDEAVLRRFPQRICVPLPDASARLSLLRHLLKGQKSSISPAQLDDIVARTEGYSCSDLSTLTREAAMHPLRDLGTRIATVKASSVRAISAQDFDAALSIARPTVGQQTLRALEQWEERTSTAR